MAGDEEKPSLRVLYTQGEREALLKELMPNGPDADSEDFRRGLNASVEEMDLVEQMIKLAFEQSGLTEFESLDDPDALSKLNAIILDLVQSLSSMFSDAPEWWTSFWCQYIVEFLWKTRKDKLTKQKQKGKLAEPGISNGIGIKTPTVITLQDMTMQLALYRQDKDDAELTEDLAATRCLSPNKPAHQPASYSLLEFISQFELVINNGRKDPIRIIHGTLGYNNKAGQFRTISKQQQFEVALLALFNNRGDGFTLKFIHREETADERNTRLAQHAASLRLQERAARKAAQKRNASGASGLPELERGRAGSTPSRHRSPPPSPRLAQVPPPALPVITSRQLAVFNSPERKGDRKAEQVRKSTAKNPRRSSRSRSQSADSKRNSSNPAGPPPTAPPNKPLPPLPTDQPSRLLKVLPVRPRREPAPPPVTNAAQKAWRRQRENKANPPPTQGPSKISTVASSSKTKAEIKRGGTSRAGLHVPSYDGIKPPAASVSKPVTARKPSPVLVPETNEISNFSDSDGGYVEPLSGNPIDQTPPESSRRKSFRNRNSLTLKENLVGNVAVPIGRKIQTAGHRVSQLISLVSPTKAEPGRGSAEYYADQRRTSVSGTLKRVSTRVTDKRIVVKPGTKKTLGVKLPKPGLLSKADSFEKRDARYKNSFEVISKQSYRRGGDEYVDAQADLFKEVENQVGAGEVEDRDTDLGDDEQPKTPGDYMVEQLQKMQNVPELAQMYDHDFSIPFPENTGVSHELTRWKECCQLFQLDPTKTSVDERVVLVGLKTPLYLYQAFGVYWQVCTARTIGGGFVGDEMGLGKTLSFLAYVVVERQLAKLWAETRMSRKDPSFQIRHLEAGECGPEAECPRAKRRGPGSGWIACPCSSPFVSLLAPKPGVRLAVVPPALVSTWVEQWDAHIDESNKDMSMRLVIAHDGTNQNLVNGKFDTRDGRHGWVRSNVGAHRLNYRSSKHKDDSEWFSDVAQDTQERILVVTTKEHYQKTWSKKFEYPSVMRSYEKSEVGELIDYKAPGIVYGIAMIDECHEEWQKNKGRSGILASLPQAGRPFVWGYSGTPLTTTPRCIEGVLWAIETLWPKSHRRDVRKQTGLEQDPKLWEFSWQRLDVICIEFETLVRQNKGSPILFKDFYQRFKPFLTMLMLRRTADTPWFGQPIIKLPPHVHEDIFVKHNTEFDAKLKQFGWAVDLPIKNKLAALYQELIERDPHRDKKTLPEKFTFNADMRMRWQMRIFATFPYLVTLGAAKHPDHLDMTVEELKKFRGRDEKTSRNPYYKMLRQIVEHSPKMMLLYSFLTGLDKTRDVNGEEHKVIIMSEFNQVAFIVKLFLEKFVQNKSNRVGLVYAGLKPAARKAIIEAFADAKDEKKNRKQQANYQYLVGTTRIIGSGLQLTRSCHVVMMEPDYEFYRELQGYARVHRIGQKNPLSRSYRLVDAGDPFEKAILMRQAERGEFPGIPDPDEENPRRYGSVTEIIAHDGGLASETTGGKAGKQPIVEDEPAEIETRKEEERKESWPRGVVTPLL